MSLTEKQIRTKLKRAGLLDMNGNPLPYAQFKNYASIQRYGSKHKIVFIGQPKENLFGFYVMYDSDPAVLKEAYNWYVRIARGDLSPIDDGDVMVGNSGIPIEYKPIKMME